MKSVLERRPRPAALWLCIGVVLCGLGIWAVFSSLVSHGESLSIKEQLGLGDISPDDVAGIRFIQNRESQWAWHTTDSDVIAEVIGHFDGLGGPQRAMGPVGGGLGIVLELQSGGDPIYIHVWSMPTIYASSAARDKDGFDIRVTQGFLSQDEWDAILARCERVEG